MTDMRATEHLLAVIAEHVTQANKVIADVLLTNIPGSIDDLEVLKARDELDKATDSIVELRRRGDTLVQGRDLELVIQALGREQIALGEDEAQALNRLDAALGGVL
jgi:hypothetical protein